MSTSRLASGLEDRPRHVFISCTDLPDSIDAHPMGGPYQRPAEEGGGRRHFPLKCGATAILRVWAGIEIEFVDDCPCGAYEMTLDRSTKDALLAIPERA